MVAAKNDNYVQGTYLLIDATAFSGYQNKAPKGLKTIKLTDKTNPKLEQFYVHGLLQRLGYAADEIHIYSRDYGNSYAKSVLEMLEAEIDETVKASRLDKGVVKLHPKVSQQYVTDLMETLLLEDVADLKPRMIMVVPSLNPAYRDKIEALRAIGYEVALMVNYINYFSAPDINLITNFDRIPQSTWGNMTYHRPEHPSDNFGVNYA